MVVAVHTDMRSSSRRDPNYGRGEYTVLAGDRLLDTATLCKKLLEAFRADSYSPPKLPRIGLELLALSRQPEVQMREILDLLTQDPLLAAAVLKTARSPVYAGTSPVTSLEQALVRLGLNTLTDIVLQTTISMEMFRAPGYDDALDTLNRHSALTAHLSRYICSASDIPNDFAFLCGLLHDVGTAASLSVLAHRRRRPPSLEVVMPAVDAAHAEAGVLVAQLWKLPEPVIDVLRLHHQLFEQGRTHRIAAAVALADGFATEAGVSLDAPATGTMSIDRAASALRFDGSQIDQLRGQVRRLINSVSPDG